MNAVKKYLAAIGAKGGSANTDAQNEARARNAKLGVGLGGWPKGKKRGKEGRKMSEKDRQTMKRLWAKEVNGGMPLTEPFEIGVVRAHFEAGFMAGLRAGRKGKKK